MANPSASDVKTLAIPEEPKAAPEAPREYRTMAVPEEPPPATQPPKPKNPFGSR